MHWFDIGVNLTNERFDIEQVISRAGDAGVESMLITGTSVEESMKALEICRQSTKGLYCTAGIHPHHASEFGPQSYATLFTLCQDPKVLAVGECGLDFNRNFSSPQQQLYAFEQQLILACELQLPVFLHERDAFAEQISLLKKYRKNLIGGVVHCFTGDCAQMLAYLELDLYIGITGWLCDPVRGMALREAVLNLPLERLMLETDAPYLRPKGLAKNRVVDKGNNEPAYLPYIAGQLSEIMALDVNIIKRHSYLNCLSLFGLNHQDYRHAN